MPLSHEANAGRARTLPPAYQPFHGKRRHFQAFVILCQALLCLNQIRSVCWVLLEMRQPQGCLDSEKFSLPVMTEAACGSAGVTSSLQADPVPCLTSRGFGVRDLRRNRPRRAPIWHAGAICSALSCNLSRLPTSEKGRDGAYGCRIIMTLFVVLRHQYACLR